MGRKGSLVAIQASAGSPGSSKAKVAYKSCVLLARSSEPHLIEPPRYRVTTGTVFFAVKAIQEEADS